MKLSYVLTLSVLAASCGNPHISSAPNLDLERTNPPITPDRSEGGATTGGTAGGSTTGGSTSGGSTTGGTVCIPSSTDVKDYQFFFGSHADGERGVVPSDYSDFKKCKNEVTEDFNSFNDSKPRSITNERSQSHSYELLHQAEGPFVNGKVVYLEDIFGAQTYTMEVEKPVSQNGAVGKDRGVDSHSANSESKDALVWNFSSPVSFWSANVLDVESSKAEPARLRLFNCSGILLKEMDVKYPNKEQGQLESHFIGFISAKAEICHVSLTVGDYEKPAPWSSRAFFRALAVDSLNYGN